jgi:glutamine synthetase
MGGEITVVDEAALQSLARRVDAGGFSGLWIIFHDYSARSCAKWIPASRFHSTILSGGVFARANLNFTIDDQQVASPFFGADSGDFFAIPDPDTFMPVPYRPGMGQVYSHLFTEEGEHWEGCPRGTLMAAVNRLAERGLSAQVAFEPEFTLFQQEEGHQPVPADTATMYSVERMDRFADLLRLVETTLAEQGVEVIQIGSEYGAGQLEINLQHAAPVAAADNVLTLRDTVKALARQDGLVASFMPKPFEHLAGNGLHVHLSLWSEDGERDLSAGTGPAGLSDEMRHFMAGVLAHSPAVCGVGAPTVNSYKRLQPASWAPAHVAYAERNRAALVRIPGSTRRRIEFRAGDHTGNPYLFLAALIAAGIDGLDRELDPGAPAEGDLGHASPEVLSGQGVTLLPRTASEALDAVERDQVVMSALGPVCGPEFLRVKRFEVMRYQRHVSQWERDVYFDRV